MNGFANIIGDIIGALGGRLTGLGGAAKDKPKTTVFTTLAGLALGAFGIDSDALAGIGRVIVRIAEAIGATPLAG